MSTKKELSEKKELARLYFMSGETRKNAAKKAGVSDVTVGKWVEAEGWDVKRAAVNVSRPELVNKLLRAINEMIDRVATGDNVDAIGGIADKLSKFAAAIERLDKKTSVVSDMETFMKLNKYLEYRMGFDKTITPELLRTFMHYQDLFINEQIKLGKK